MVMSLIYLSYLSVYLSLVMPVANKPIGEGKIVMSYYQGKYNWPVANRMGINGHMSDKVENGGLVSFCNCKWTNLPDWSSFTLLCNVLP